MTDRITAEVTGHNEPVRLGRVMFMVPETVFAEPDMLEILPNDVGVPEPQGS
jgi:hypothetical protein